MTTPENTQNPSSDKLISDDNKSIPPETFLDKATTGKGLLIAAVVILFVTILMIFFNNYSLTQSYILSTKDFWGYLTQALGAMLGLALAAKAVQLSKQNDEQQKAFNIAVETHNIKIAELTGRQNEISGKQLILDTDAKNPDRTIYIAGVNSLLELDSYAVMLVSTGKAYLGMLECSQSDRDSLRAQLTALLNAANSPFLLQFINRLPERQKNLGLIRDLRGALFLSAEINLKMPLKNNYSAEQYLDWMMARSKWSSQQAAALMSVIDSSIKLSSNVRRLSIEFNCDKQLDILERVQEVNLTETAAIDLISKHKLNAVEKINSNCVIDIVDDGESLKKLICSLTSIFGDKNGLKKKKTPIENENRQDAYSNNIWEENVKNFKVYENEYAIFHSFEDYSRVAYSEERRVKGTIDSMGSGLIIVIDNPYGAENQSREQIEARLVRDDFQALNSSAIVFSGADCREPIKIWSIAESLAKLPKESEILKDLHNSTRFLIKSVESYRANSDIEEHGNYHEKDNASPNAWTKVKELIGLQKDVVKIFSGEPMKIASDYYLLDYDKVAPNLIWVCLNVHGDNQLAGAGDWAFSMFGKNGRYFWDNIDNKLYRKETHNV